MVLCALAWLILRLPRITGVAEAENGPRGEKIKVLAKSVSWGTEVLIHA